MEWTTPLFSLYPRSKKRADFTLVVDKIIEGAFMKWFASCLGVTLLMLNFLGKDRNLTPDYFQCFDGCNTCYFRIHRSGFSQIIINEGCTEVACLGKISQAEREEFSRCSSNWLFSRSIGYDRFSVFVNNCINGYRNFTYVERQQENNPNSSLADIYTLEHTRKALSEGIPSCKKLETFLQRKADFSQKQIGNFGVYLRDRNFTNPYDYSYTVSGMLEAIQNQKLIFNYLSENPHNLSNLVTSKMIEEFFTSYTSYLDDRAKYGEETFEQRRDRLFSN